MPKKEIYLYGPIGKGFDPFTGEPNNDARSMIRQMNELDGADFTLRINSDGGDVFEAKAISEAFARYPGQITAQVDAVAASAASFVAATVDLVEMAPGTYVMIHNPYSWLMGDSREFRQMADLLDQIRDLTIFQAYRERGVTIPDEDLRAMLDAETWLEADEAIRLGFADGLSREPEGAVAALVRPGIWSKIPPEVLKMGIPPEKPHKPASEAFGNMAENIRAAHVRNATAAVAAKMRAGRARRAARG